MRPSPPRSHHVAHGTLGIVIALARVGAAAGRADLVELAVAGAEDVVSRHEGGPDGFLVPHSDPPHRPELIERWSFGWCNGPAGDAQAFRVLRAVTGEPRWASLGDRCWHTVTTSGLPARLRPGFWDNNGRCCGTAGVLATGLDRRAEGSLAGPFVEVLVDDLAARATRAPGGARWSNVEHRAEQHTEPRAEPHAESRAGPHAGPRAESRAGPRAGPHAGPQAGPRDLPPERGWAMGSAGILRELLRWRRMGRGGDPAYAVAWPDQLPPPELRSPAGRRGRQAPADGPGVAGSGA